MAFEFEIRFVRGEISRKLKMEIDRDRFLGKNRRRMQGFYNPCKSPKYSRMIDDVAGSRLIACQSCALHIGKEVFPLENSPRMFFPT